MTDLAPPSRPLATRLLRWLPGLLGMGLLLWCLRSVDGAAWRHHLLSLPAWVWLVAVLGGLLSHACRAWRLQTEWRAWSVQTRFAQALRIAVLHNAWTQLMPLRTGELSYVWLLRRHAGVGWQDAAGSLLWLRVQDAVVLSGLAVLTGALVLLGRSDLAPAAWPGGLLAGAVVGSLLLVAAAGALAAWAWRRSRTSGSLETSQRAQAWAAAWHHRHGGTAGWLLCAAHWTIKLTVAASLLAIVATLPVAVSWVAAVGGELGAVLPLQAPAGLGPYEAGLWAGARWASQGPDPITWTRFLPQALLVHGLSISVSLAAAAVAAAAGLRSPAAAPSQPPDTSASASPPWTPCPP